MRINLINSQTKRAYCLRRHEPPNVCFSDESSFAPTERKSARRTRHAPNAPLICPNRVSSADGDADDDVFVRCVQRTWARERTPGFNDYAKWVHTFLGGHGCIIFSGWLADSAYSNEPGAYYFMLMVIIHSLCILSLSANTSYGNSLRAALVREPFFESRRATEESAAPRARDERDS